MARHLKSTGDLEIMPFDNIIFDELGSWDDVGYKFTAVESGYYLFILSSTINSTRGADTARFSIQKNGTILSKLNIISGGVTKYLIVCDYLDIGDEITAVSGHDPFIPGLPILYYSDEDKTYFNIVRLL